MENLMNKIRVQLAEGAKPIIFVAPHGSDDTNTDLIVENLAISTDGYAVINKGFKRSDKVDIFKERANCNNIEHCHYDVVKEEFLDPLLRFKNRILKKWARVCIVYIHGMGNFIQKNTGIDDLNYVVGWGKGEPPSPTCQKWVKNFIIYNLSDTCTVGEGKAGGNYAAWSKNNMTQLFRKYYHDKEVDSMQIEIVYDIRRSVAQAELTSSNLAETMNALLTQDAAWKPSTELKVPQI